MPRILPLTNPLMYRSCIENYLEWDASSCQWWLTLGKRLRLRSEVGLFILCISVLFEIICALTSIFVELGLFFLQNSLFKYKNNKTLPCTNHPKWRDVFFHFFHICLRKFCFHICLRKFFKLKLYCWIVLCSPILFLSSLKSTTVINLSYLHSCFYSSITKI